MRKSFLYGWIGLCWLGLCFSFGCVALQTELRRKLKGIDKGKLLRSKKGRRGGDSTRESRKKEERGGWGSGDKLRSERSGGSSGGKLRSEKAVGEKSTSHYIAELRKARTFRERLPALKALVNAPPKELVPVAEILGESLYQAVRSMKVRYLGLVKDLLKILKALGPAAAPASPWLAKALYFRYTERIWRQEVGDILIKLGPRAQSGLSVLLKGLSYPYSPRQADIVALQVIAKIGEKGAPAVPVLMNILMKDEKNELRREAKLELEKAFIGVGEPALQALLQKLRELQELKKKKDLGRFERLSILARESRLMVLAAKFESKSPWLMAVLLGNLADFQQRKAAIEGLVKIGVPAVSLVARKMVATDSREVAKACQKVLSRIGEKALPVLYEELKKSPRKWRLIKMIYQIQKGKLSEPLERELFGSGRFDQLLPIEKEIVQRFLNSKPYEDALILEKAAKKLLKHRSGQKGLPIVIFLGHSLEDPDPNLARHGGVFLEALSPNISSALDALIRALESFHRRGDKGVAPFMGALAKMGPKAAKAAPVMTKFLSLSDVFGEQLSKLGEAGVKELLKGLSSSNISVRMNVSYGLGFAKRAWRRVIPPLSRVAKEDSFYGVRVNAIEALERLGILNQLVIDTWRHTLKDRHERVCVATIQIARRLGARAYPLVKDLLNLLDSPRNSYIKGNVIEALGYIGARHPGVVPALRKFLGQGYVVAATSLGKIGRRAAAAVPDLAFQLRNSSNIKMRIQAAWALGQIGANTRVSLPALQYALNLRGRTPREVKVLAPIREMAAKALGKFGPRAAPAVKSLVNALRDDFSYVRGNAAWAIGQVGLPGGARAIGRLILLLDDPVFSVRREAVIALGRLAPRAKVALPKVRQKFRQGTIDRTAAAFALLSLSNSGEDNAKARKILLKSLRYNFKNTLKYLEFLGQKASFALPVLKKKYARLKGKKIGKRLKRLIQRLER